MFSPKGYVGGGTADSGEADCYIGNSAAGLQVRQVRNDVPGRVSDCERLELSKLKIY
jgi:hypothetical protein